MLKAEHLLKFVSCRGITKTFNLGDKAYTINHYIENDIEKCLIYCRLDHLEKNAKYILNYTNIPFILVTGDADNSLDEKLLSNPYVKKIYENHLLIRWYSQNLSIDKPKLYHLPIGLDYHTMYYRPKFLGDLVLSPYQQEVILTDIFKKSLFSSDRKFKIYCDWHFRMFRADRKECYESIDHSICFFPTERKPRTESWMMQSEMMFVASPFGRGYDCNRTWEALALGCIPILKKSPIQKLFEDLPCIFVDDWKQVNSSFLEEQVNSLSKKRFLWNKMYLKYWIDNIKGYNTEKNFLSLKEIKT